MSRSRGLVIGCPLRGASSKSPPHTPRGLTYSRRRIQLAILLLPLLILAACVNNNNLALWGPGGTQGQTSTNPITQNGGLIIQASPTLQPVIQAMQAAFFSTYHRNIPIVFDYSDSKKLVNNINTAITVDLLITDDEQSMRDASASGVTRSAGIPLATDMLTVVLPSTNPGKITTLQDLARPGVRYLAISPDSGLNLHVVALLERMNLDPAFGSDYSARVTGNIIRNYPDGPSAAQAIAAPIPRGDFAIVYHTNALEIQKTQGPDALHELPLPAQFNPPIPMLAAVVKQASNPALAQQFLDFMRSPQAAAIWTQFGFTPAA